MPIFERPPKETLSPSKDRWTPLFLEHGRLEVDDSSVKWISAEAAVLRLPIATISALLLGPGTTVTHAAMKACADCNTPVCWVGSEGLHFYSYGISPTFDNSRARHQAALQNTKSKREKVALQMFRMRFGKDVGIEGHSIDVLRGMEGKRVKNLYADFGARFGVTWKGRNYNSNNWQLADNINKMISTCNAALYALTTAVVCSMGYLPQLGFIHTSGTLPFVFDIADIYKPETTLPAAFETIKINPKADEKSGLTRFKSYVEQSQLIRRMPQDIESLLKIEEL